MRRASVILAIARVIIPAVLASFVCVLLSAVAFRLGAIAYRRVPAPRLRTRVVELAALVLPLVIVGAYAASLLLAF